LIVPPYLQQGDTVALIAPARFMDMSVISHFEKWVVSNGWILKQSPNLGQKDNQLGGNPQKRLSDIIWALQDQEIKAVFMARGGYGTMQLLSELRKIDFTQFPKWWVGFSDITALHITLQQQGMASLHGPMAMQFDSNTKCSTKSRKELAGRLKGAPLHFEVDASVVSGLPQRMINSKIKNTEFSAPLWGGNLSMIFAMLASGAKWPSTPFVLFIEDLDEYLYHIDRMMQALDLSGLLESSVAVMVGSMSDMHDNASPFGKNAKEIVMNICEKHNKPLIWGLPCGHEADNVALKLGFDITFDGNNLIQS